MRIAIGLRGITYRENHVYNQQYNQPYTIDFCDVIENSKHYGLTYKPNSSFMSISEYIP